MAKYLSITYANQVVGKEYNLGYAHCLAPIIYIMNFLLFSIRLQTSDEEVKGIRNVFSEVMYPEG